MYKSLQNKNKQKSPTSTNNFVLLKSKIAKANVPIKWLS